MECAHVACGRLCRELLSANSQRIRTARTAFALPWENSANSAHLVVEMNWNQSFVRFQFASWMIFQLLPTTQSCSIPFGKAILCSNLGQDDYIYPSHMAEAIIYTMAKAPRWPLTDTVGRLSPIWGKGTQPIQNSHQIPKNTGNDKKTPGGMFHLTIWRGPYF